MVKMQKGIRNGVAQTAVVTHSAYFTSRNEQDCRQPVKDLQGHPHQSIPLIFH